MTALTRNETRALIVAAHGHTAAMCGRLLGCSARHYNRLAASARDALGARSLIHAVAIAAASGLITVTPCPPHRTGGHEPMTDDRTCRRFQLVRREDETGVSGTGVVAYGAAFPDGTAVLRWDTKVNSTVLYDSLDDLKTIHGHGGKTAVMWLDTPPAADYGSVWTELRGYVQQAADDGTQITPVDMLAYLDELHRRALAPVGEWMKSLEAPDA